MALRIVAAIMAEGVALDSFTGRLTAFNMMEAVYAPSFPAVLGKLAVVNLYEVDGGREREHHWERVTIVDGDGRQVGEAVAELSGEGVAHRSMAFFQGLRLEKPGVCDVVVAASRRQEGPWEVVARRRLHVELRAHPLARPDEKNPDAGKITGPAVITD